MPNERSYAPAKRSLGQNFLRDANIARRIVSALDIGPDDHVLEIGPGRGALTRLLLERGPARLCVLERDDDLAQALEEDLPAVEVLRADALAHPWESLEAAERWKLVGNLPYNIASPLIWEIVSRARFERAVFMVQLEVGQRLVAPPGGKEYGGLSAFVQNHARGELLFRVPPQVFRPQPKVTSAVLRFFLRPDAPGAEATRALASLLRICFQQRRKQLGTILKSKDITGWEDALRSLDIDPVQRPETLAPERFLALANLLAYDFPA